MLTPKTHRIAIHFAFALLVAGLLFVTSVVPHTTRVDHDRYAATNEESAKHLIDRRIADYTLALALFTGMLAVSTIGLWVSTGDSIRLAREEFIASHRPAIRIKHVKLERDIEQNKPVVVSLTCLNNGEAEAILQEMGLKYLIARNDRDLPMETDIPAIFNFFDSRVPVGRNVPIPNIRTTKILTPQEEADIQQCRAKLYCVGWVSYLDDAKPKRMRITGFCRVLTFPATALADVLHARFRTHPDPDYEYED